jgi:7-alpha-hydroxysteroid dehydrogenase
MSDGFSGRSVIVTGAANGIGLATARRFVRAGASVMMADIEEDKLEREVETMGSEGFDGQVQAFHGDLRERLATSNLMAATIDAYDEIHVLVNTARMLATGDPLDPASDRFEEVLQQNVTTKLRLSQAAARRMIDLASADGATPVDRAIVNVSSIYGQRCLPRLLAYSVAAAALDQTTRCLAMALAGHGIRVNAVAPGGIVGQALTDTLTEIEDLQDAVREVTPLGRLGEFNNIADAILFLASTASEFTTGQILTVDGGRSLLDPLEGAAI